MVLTAWQRTGNNISYFTHNICNEVGNYLPDINFLGSFLLFSSMCLIFCMWLAVYFEKKSDIFLSREALTVQNFIDRGTFFV